MKFANCQHVVLLHLPNWQAQFRPNKNICRSCEQNKAGESRVWYWLLIGFSSVGWNRHCSPAVPSRPGNNIHIQSRLIRGKNHIKVKVVLLWYMQMRKVKVFWCLNIKRLLSCLEFGLLFLFDDGKDWIELLNHLNGSVMIRTGKCSRLIIKRIKGNWSLVTSKTVLLTKCTLYQY